jgi:hypothetical protein
VGARLRIKWLRMLALAIKDPDVRGSAALAVFCAMMGYVNFHPGQHFGRAWPSAQRLAEQLGVYPTTVQRALALLRERGYLKVIENQKGGRGKSPVYVLGNHSDGLPTDTPQGGAPAVATNPPERERIAPVRRFEKQNGPHLSTERTALAHAKDRTGADRTLRGTLKEPTPVGPLPRSAALREGSAPRGRSVGAHGEETSDWDLAREEQARTEDREAQVKFIRGYRSRDPAVLARVPGLAAAGRRRREMIA